VCITVRYSLHVYIYKCINTLTLFFQLTIIVTIGKLFRLKSILEKGLC